MERMASEQQTPATSTSTAEAPRATENRSTTPRSASFGEYIASGWQARPESRAARRPVADAAAGRRARVAALHPGERLVVAAGTRRTRSNDTDYPFRPHSAFAWLTGWGADAEPGSLLVFEPAGETHEMTLYFPPAAGRDTDEFYANPEVGEFWIGARPSLGDVAVELGVATADLRTFETTTGDVTLDDAAFARDLSELRLVKDADEVDELRAAVAATAAGFDDVLDALPRVLAHERGERLVEGVFFTRARADGNDVGYGTIAAAGPHACILHWTRNDGPVAAGDLILIDAGVELPSLYTADITRTIPVSGTFTPTQREVYEAVREAADAAFAIVRPGIRFREIHATAMRVIAERTAAWGLLPVTAEQALEADNQQHRRYMVHGTSHHLGLDVHDCAQARREMYLDGVLEPGMVFTIEPGLYFQPDDLTVPERFRGIGVRIEDNILVTADGAENLSIAIPRTADEVEAWVGRHAG